MFFTMILIADKGNLIDYLLIKTIIVLNEIIQKWIKNQFQK